MTVGEYRYFVDDGGYQQEQYWEGGGFGERHQPDGWGEQLAHPNRPVVGVSWCEAAAYAAWAGCSLPTEAQWERAARGTEPRRYPWGSDLEPGPSLLNCDFKMGHPTPVGVYPRGATPNGILDMAGNVWEWCHGWPQRTDSRPGLPVTLPTVRQEMRLINKPDCTSWPVIGELQRALRSHVAGRPIEVPPHQTAIWGELAPLVERRDMITARKNNLVATHLLTPTDEVGDQQSSHPTTTSVLADYHILDMANCRTASQQLCLNKQGSRADEPIPIESDDGVPSLTKTLPKNLAGFMKLNGGRRAKLVEETEVLGGQMCTKQRPNGNVVHEVVLTRNSARLRYNASVGTPKEA